MVVVPGSFAGRQMFSTGLVLNLLLLCTTPYDNAFNDSRL